MISANPRHNRSAKLPTSLITLVLLGIALLPLGVVAVLNSANQAQGARQDRLAEVNLLAEVGANHLERSIADYRQELQSAVMQIAASEDGRENCNAILADIFGAEPDLAALIIRNGNDAAICAIGADSAAAMPVQRPQPGATETLLDAETPAVILSFADRDGTLAGTMVLTRESIALLPQPGVLDRNYQIALSGGDETVVIRPWAEHSAEEPILTASEPIGDTGMTLSASFERAPLSISEMFGIALPVLMWVVAAILGWIAITLLLIRPLRELRKAVIGHANGETEFATPDLPIAAIEIQQLGDAFEETFDTLQSHEEQLAAGLEEQTRLTREVHHRVKNNLQIIASLLNLHARSAKSEDGAAAYASIQRRVDALAIVQRNLFAELEKDAGLPLRPVLAELASGLQQSAPASVEIAIMLDIDPVRVGQDIAAPACFLVTELVELAMLSETRVEIAIAVTALADRSARLSVRSQALAQASQREEFARYRRVLTGMARQLQASLDEEESGTLFTIMIPTLQFP